jgi:multidrug efflux system outer membrane protein
MSRFLPWLFCCFAVFTAGCSLGPNYSRPDLGIEVPEVYVAAPAGEAGTLLPQDRWWRGFNAPGLNTLVSEVVENNTDIRQAAAAVLEYRSVLRQRRADEYPVLDLQTQALRQEQSVANLFGEPATVRTDTFSLTLPASFEIDLWGRLSRATEAARADLLAAEENRHTVVQSLVAEAVSQYFTISSLNAQLRITRRLVETFQENLDLVEARYQQGLSSILDVRQARRSLAQSEAEIPTLVQAVGRTRQALSVLKGAYPDLAAGPESEEWDLELPPAVPAGLPAELLNRRPDIRSAEASLKAACERIGVAKASRFPSISLTGSFGYSSDEISALFEPDGELWRIASGAFQPLFDGGLRQAAQRAAEARYHRQLAAYASTVLQAFADVESALLTREQQIKRYKRLTEYRNEADRTLDTALDRYQRGLASYLNVLDAQRALFQSELSLVETRNAIYTNRVALHRALGGDWGRMGDSDQRIESPVNKAKL